MIWWWWWWWWNSNTKHIVFVHIIHVWVYIRMMDSVYVHIRSQQWLLLVLCGGRAALEGTTIAAAKLSFCDHLQQTIPRLIRLPFSGGICSWMCLMIDCPQCCFFLVVDQWYYCLQVPDVRVEFIISRIRYNGGRRGGGEGGEVESLRQRPLQGRALQGGFRRLLY